MFCPRCGRAINENANFCGGCGLSRAEIEKFAQTAKVNSEAAQNTAQEQPVKSEVPFGTVVNETAEAANAPAEEKAYTETIKEDVSKDTDTAQVQDKQPEYQQPEIKPEPAAKTESSYTAPKGAEYHYSAADGSYQNATQNTSQYSYTQPVTPIKNENLSTVDFIWIMIISSIPLVGLIYLIYLAIQDNNTNKRSYARASLIISVFATVVAFVFVIGFIMAGI